MMKICVFTATRAEYGLLRGVIFGLRDHPGIDVQLIASGTHLSSVHGGTLSELVEDGLNADRVIDILEYDDSPLGVCRSMGSALSGYGKALTELSPDLLVVLGDRYETFCAAGAAQVCRIPVVHVHGGEITEGVVDDAFRHSITKMAQIHFCGCADYRRRVIQLGEHPDRVFDVGALGVENVSRLPKMDKAELLGELGVPKEGPYFLSTLHPVTLEDTSDLAQVESLLSALQAFPSHRVIFTKANADSGGRIINERLEAAARDNPGRFFCYASLGLNRYLSAAKWADLVVGNSSSGILEVPALGVPTVNIGDRQKGRMQLPTVIDCPAEAVAIESAIRLALMPDFRSGIEGFRHPCDGGATADRIVQKLVALGLPLPMKKTFFDLPPAVEQNGGKHDS